MGKTEAPKTISRYSLVMTLQRQYNGNSPFVIKKDGKEVYDFQTDKLEFTCCNNMEHKHFMTPLRMLQLVYIYGSNPCPICNPKGLREKKKDKGSFGQEDGSIISETKKYLESSDPTETAKRMSEVQIEIEEEKRKIKELEKKREKEQKESEEDIVESIPYDEYIEKENPNYNPNNITTVDSENNIEEKTVEEIEAEIVNEDDDIVESETFDDYVLQNPDYDEKIIENDLLNKKPKSKFDLDYIFSNAQEEGSVFAVEKEDHVNETKDKHVRQNNLNNNEIKSENDKIELQEIERKNDNTNITKLAYEIKNENLNEDNTNILLTESNENEKSSEFDEGDEEEEFSF
jgi:hypothetical protein